MEFKIIYGRSGCGKTTYIFNEIKEKINGKNKIYIIVPEQFSFSAENHLLETIDGNSSINAEVLTLSRMANRVINEVLGNVTTHLSKIGKSMIVYDAIDSLKKNMNFLRNSDKNLELSLRMITEFKKHNVNAEMIDEVMEKIDNKYLQLKLADARNILKKYQDRIQGNYIDEADSLDLLAQNIELVDFFNDAIIYIDEFAGFTPNEYQIIEKLCTLAKEINVTICTDSLEKVDNVDESIYYFNQICAEKLIEIAKRNGCFINKVDLGDSKKFKSKELEVLEKSIYSVKPLVCKEETKDVSLFIAQNPLTEIENVAQKILKLVKQENYRFKDIAVVCANIDTYASDVKSVFEKYEIPVFIDEKKDINNNVLMKYMVSLLNVFTTNFSYEAMFSYIKSGMFDISEDDIFLLENYVNKWGIRGSKWYKEDFEFEEKNDVQDRINDARRAIVVPIMDFKKSLTGEKTAKEISLNLYEFIQKNGVQQKILNRADEFEKAGDVELAEEYRNGI